MTGEQFGGVLRAVISAVGGYFVGKGMIDSETVVSVGGAMATIGTAIWSIIAKKKAA